MRCNSASLVFLLATGTCAAASAADLAVEGGAASFVVTTSVPAISVKGKSTAMRARVRVNRDSESLRLEQIQAWMPVNSLLTGMAIRDEHMRRYIFTAGDGTAPDVRFEAEGASCASTNGKGSELRCSVAGTLAIRGVARPFSIGLKVRAEGSAFRTAGDSTVRLSDYGIEQPSQFGVKTANEIELHVDFIAKEAPASAASGARR